MFTGLIQDVGTIDAVEVAREGARLRISTRLATELESGDSVAVDGVCLTATRTGGGGFAADVMNPTLRATALGALEPGSRVNLEPAMRPSDRLGGHIVQGHVDGAREVQGIFEDGFSRRLRIDVGPELARYAVEKGSVAINGVSLTLTAVTREGIEISLIPETILRTNLGEAMPGHMVNVECDLIAKYVERIVGPLAGTGKESE